MWNDKIIVPHMLYNGLPGIYERVNRYIRIYTDYLLDFCALVCYTVPVPKARLGEGK